MTSDPQLLRSPVPAQDVCPGSRHRTLHADPSKEPVLGEPVWCQACVEDIARAIGALPDLAADLWDLGHWTVDPDQPVVSRRVGQTVVSVVVPFAPVYRFDLVEALACGHRWPTRSAAREDLLPAPATTRHCWQCALDDPGADGRLAPVPTAGRRGPRLVGSPAGSPSYLAVDELVSWATRTLNYLRGLMPAGSGPDSYVDVRRATDHVRGAALSTTCSVLVEWCYYLLATPRAKTIGREALDLERRARRGAGVDTPHPTPLPGVPCPKCDLVALKRAGHDPDLILCSSCGLITHDRDLPDAGA